MHGPLRLPPNLIVSVHDWLPSSGYVRGRGQNRAAHFCIFVICLKKCSRMCTVCVFLHIFLQGQASALSPPSAMCLRVGAAKGCPSSLPAGLLPRDALPRVHSLQEADAGAVPADLPHQPGGGRRGGLLHARIRGKVVATNLWHIPSRGFNVQCLMVSICQSSIHVHVLPGLVSVLFAANEGG